MVASGVDFFAGISVAVEELGAGLTLALLLAEGDEDFAGEVDAAGLGVGETVFSVVTETLGSDDVLFSDAVSSGDAAGDGLSSWANASGTAPANRAVAARTAIFIGSPFGILQRPEPGIA